MTLVLLEGTDGAGKSSLAKAIQDAHPDAVLTNEPTPTWVGEAVRRCIADEDSDPMMEAFLFLADHANNVARIRPHLGAGRLVVSDRWSLSCLAYQGITLHEAGLFPSPEAAREHLRACMAPFEPEVDLCILLEVDPKVGVARKDGDLEKFEDATFLRSVQAAYRDAVQPLPHRIIDAGRSFDEVRDDVLAAVAEVHP